MSREPHIPRATGIEALSELDRVEWSSLSHAYGEGRVGVDLAGDVEGSLALIADDVETATTEGLYSNVCHQGTVYQASAYALPFVIAVAAGNVSTTTRLHLVALLADIAVGGSHVAANGSSAGAHGAGVDVLIRATVVRCDPFLTLIVQADAGLAPLVSAIRELADDPSEEKTQAILRLIDPSE